jgi:hypothetical protein
MSMILETRGELQLRLEVSEHHGFLTMQVSHGSMCSEFICLVLFRSWLERHPDENVRRSATALGPPDTSQALSHVIRMFEQASQSAPTDFEVWMAFLSMFVITCSLSFFVATLLVSYCIALHCIALYCIVLYCIVLYCIVYAIHCIVLY